MFNSILIPIDLAHESSWRTALPVAVNHARHEGGKLHVLTVVDLNLDVTAVVMPEDFNRQYQSKTEQRLAALVKTQVPDDVSVQYSVRDGRIYHEILVAADEIGADLIVLASHRPSFRDYMLGSNAARVVRHANCSVLVVRDQDAPQA